MSSNPQNIESDLRKKISGEVLFDEISRTLFSTDACMYQIKPLGVVVPRNIEDVIETVRYCSERQIPITSRGAGTSLAGQSIGSGIILVFNKYFREILGIDEAKQSASVQPGVVLDKLDRYLLPHGVMFGPDPSTGKQCVIGGMIGTNAAGPHTVKYGATKDNVLELKVVTSGGELRTFSAEASENEFIRKVGDILLPHKNLIDKRFPKTSKNSSGYNLKDTVKDGAIDLTKLLCGSEGTLGIVVEARLKLVRLPKERRNLIAYFSSYESCAAAAKDSLQFGPSAVEMLDKTFSNTALGIDPVLDEILKQNFVSIVIFEFEETEPGLAEGKISRLSEHLKILGLSQRQIMPRDQNEASKLWRVRKEASAIFYKIEKPGKKTSFVEDVAVPIERLPVYLVGVQRILKRYDLQCALYGHAGDGNTHTILLLDQKNREHLAKIDPIANEIYDLAISLGGTLSGEHGDGLLRTPFLSKLYGEEIYSLFKGVKEIFDPDGIMNPGKIIGSQNESVVHDLRYGENYRRVGTATSLDEADMANEIEKCHGCGLCLSYCPTALATFDERATPRAKGNVLRGIISGGLDSDILGKQDFKDVLDYCFNCKLCLTECPTQIDIPGMVIEAKTIFFEKTEKSRQDKFINRLPIFSAAASVSPTIANLASGLKIFRKLTEKLFGIDYRRQLPLFHKPLFKRIGLNRKTETPQGRVIYFSGCFANYNDVTGEGLAAVEVLRRNRIDVRVLDSLRCCGIARITTGSKSEVIPDAAWNTAQLETYIDQGFDIVFSAPSCALAVKEDYPILLATSSAEKVAAHSFELSDYLSVLHKEGKLNTDFGPIEKSVTYHNPCHSIPLGVRKQPIDLMRLIPDLEILELDEDTCCGMAGTFGLKKQFYDLSMEAGANLFDQIKDRKVDSVITTCGTCNIQISQGANVKVEHLAKILLESYRMYDGTAGQHKNAQKGFSDEETVSKILQTDSFGKSLIE
ncbi:MAG TPA: anaerobic glycerol-3-phosphate dehydrogenase subunit C [Candidatus Acidoferrales bacterium]|nr:anaerobic glycerol-3-phosphate dehydrogenase subunit C [Candidatus Acidoferrales bacterium]